MRTRRGHRLAAVACALAALAAPLAIAACGDEGDDGSAAEPDGRQASGHAMGSTIPAQIDENPHGFVSSAVLRPVVNAWRASSGRHFTEVEAGALATDKSTGAFAIFRHDFKGISQDATLVKVKDAGPLRITGAPVGRRVQKSAQRNGEIDFVGARGIRGTLELSDDTVTVDEP